MKYAYAICGIVSAIAIAQGANWHILTLGICSILTYAAAKAGKQE